VVEHRRHLIYERRLWRLLSSLATEKRVRSEQSASGDGNKRAAWDIARHE
jgi:hypothetical protein